MIGAEIMDLQMADAQFYIMIGILTAIAAIISTEVRNSKELRATRAGQWARLLVAAVWVNVFQIMLVMIRKNDFGSLMEEKAVHFYMHMFSLVLLALLAVLWYVSVAKDEGKSTIPPKSPAKASTRSKGKKP